MPSSRAAAGSGHRANASRAKPRDWSFTRGFWLKSIGVAAAVGLDRPLGGVASGAERLSSSGR